VLIVENDPERVETDLAAGLVACPRCGGRLACWSFARRRTLRGEAGPLVVRPRRGRCRSCRSTHVLLPDVALLRRVDAASVIGRALMDAAAGAGHRRIAGRLARPASTVRGWLRRLRSGSALKPAGSWATRRWWLNSVEGERPRCSMSAFRALRRPSDGPATTL
jgi:hypothetical protein